MENGLKTVCFSNIKCSNAGRLGLGSPRAYANTSLPGQTRLALTTTAAGLAAAIQVDLIVSIDYGKRRAAQREQLTAGLDDPRNCSDLALAVILAANGRHHGGTN